MPLLRNPENILLALPDSGAKWRILAIIKAIRLLISAGGIDLAAALGFFTVMSLLPLLALIMMILVMIGNPEGTTETLTQSLDYFFPASQELIGEAVDNLMGVSVTFGILAVGSLFMSANGLFVAIHRAINRVYGVRRKNVARLTFANILLATLVLILFLMSVGLGSLIRVLFVYSEELFSDAGTLSDVSIVALGAISAIIPPIFTGFMFAIIYDRVPNANVPWRDAVFGALVAVSLFEISKHVLFWLIDSTSDRSVVYGPIASVVMLMIWAYISGIVLLLGAAITKLSSELRPEA